MSSNFVKHEVVELYIMINPRLVLVVYYLGD